MTVAEARARERVRLRDSASDYTNPVLDDLRLAALRDLAAQVRSIYAEFYLTRKIVKLFDDALDPDPGIYEFYKLPSDLSQLRWIERADGSFHYPLTQIRTSRQEVARFRRPLVGTLNFLNGQPVSNLPLLGAGGMTFSIHGDRFRIIPPPVATGWLLGIYYIRQPLPFNGDKDLVDIPVEFEEALCLDVAFRALMIDGDQQAQNIQAMLTRTVELASKSLRDRPRTDLDHLRNL